MLFARRLAQRNAEREAQEEIAAHGHDGSPLQTWVDDKYTLDPDTCLSHTLSLHSAVRQSPLKSRVNTLALLHRREGSSNGRGRHVGNFCRSEQVHLTTRFLPSAQDLSLKEDGRGRGQAYIGQFSESGDMFTAVFGASVRLYDVDGWRLRKEVFARNRAPRDTALSPDGRFLVYASMSPVVHIVSTAPVEGGGIESVQNVTELHDSLDFGTEQHRFALFTLRFSSDGREIIAGSNDRSIYLWDLESNRRTLRLQGHEDDINAVSFLDSSSQVLATGSDDTFVKIWDRRDLSSEKPCGVLLGHTQGVAYIDAKMDGRHLISNGKDQCVKLWDIRKMMPSSDFNSMPERDRVVANGRHFLWDYYRPYPASWASVRHPHDCSLATFRGHKVLRTLIRCHFSPRHTTGQRYIYTGSQCGAVHIYDIVTGELVRKLRRRGHGARVLVRDCSWHPTDPQLVAVWWDGALGAWECKSRLGGESEDEDVPPGIGNGMEEGSSDDEDQLGFGYF